MRLFLPWPLLRGGEEDENAPTFYPAYSLPDERIADDHPVPLTLPRLAPKPCQKAKGETNYMENMIDINGMSFSCY